MSFSHLDAGTPEDDWAEAVWPAALPPLPLDVLRRLVVVAAHPDDETLGAGGLLARATRLGLPITVLVLSDGEASHPDSPTHSPAQIAALRRTEVTDAVAALAPGARLRLLQLPDGALSDNVDSAAEAIRAALGADGAGTWLVAPWRMDGHPDHTAASTAAQLAIRATQARLFEYPIWAWHWASPTSAVWPAGALRGLSLTNAELAAKVRAMATHRSQVQALSASTGDEPVLQAGFAAHFARSFETFIEMTPQVSDNVAADDAAAGTLGSPYFDAIYRNEPDPWGFETRWYEKRKRALTLAALPRERFAAALELGCSTGVLTAGLADRCDTVLAVDLVEQPLRIARERLAGRAEIRFERRTLPEEWPDGRFDLIVLSEIGYYFSVPDLRRLLEHCRASLRSGGALVACHWRHRVADYPISGDIVHAHLGHVAGLQRTVHHQEYDFLLEVFEPRPARSVAQREDLVP